MTNSTLSQVNPARALCEAAQFVSDASKFIQLVNRDSPVTADVSERFEGRSTSSTLPFEMLSLSVALSNRRIYST